MRACLLVRRLMNLFCWDTDEYFQIMIFSQEFNKNWKKEDYVQSWLMPGVQVLVRVEDVMIIWGDQIYARVSIGSPKVRDRTNL